jgi:hypothetical protein
MCELHDRDHRREGQPLRWRDVRGPRSLHIVGLHKQVPPKKQNKETGSFPESESLIRRTYYVPLSGPGARR